MSTLTILTIALVVTLALAGACLFLSTQPSEAESQASIRAWRDRTYGGEWNG